jgi:hypothetical protein
LLVEDDGERLAFRNPLVVAFELKKEWESGKWGTQRDFAAALGICFTRLKAVLSLTRLDPIAQEILLSLGPILTTSLITDSKLHPLVKLPAEEQVLRVKQMIDKAGIKLTEESA